MLYIQPVHRLPQVRFTFEYADGSGSPTVNFFFSVFDVGKTEYFAAEETYTDAACGGGELAPHPTANVSLPPCRNYCTAGISAAVF